LVPCRGDGQPVSSRRTADARQPTLRTAFSFAAAKVPRRQSTDQAIEKNGIDEKRVCGCGHGVAQGGLDRPEHGPRWERVVAWVRLGGAASTSGTATAVATGVTVTEGVAGETIAVVAAEATAIGSGSVVVMAEAGSVGSIATGTTIAASSGLR